MIETTLQQVIKQHVLLPAYPTKRGWYAVLCRVCKDHGQKGDRAGFKFDGDIVGYSCFNCGHSAVFDPNKDDTISQNMQTVLSSFGIEKTEWNKALFASAVNGTTHRKSSTIDVSIEPSELQLPSYFYPLTDDKQDQYAQFAIDYLNNRQVDYNKHRFYMSHLTDDKTSKKWFGRLIIPIYKDNKLIFWQGRDLTNQRAKKYLSVDHPRDNVLTNYDILSQRVNTPVYVTEGWFDSYFLDGVAVLGPKITPNQVKWLNKTNRQKVIIPDRLGDGWRLANQALSLGWSVSTPDIGSCKDVNDAVIKYGLLYTLKTIADNTYQGEEGMFRVKMYCQINNNKRID